MSEVEIPELLRERLTTRERALYQRVQLVVRGSDTNLDVEAELLDQLFDRLFAAIRHERIAEQEVQETRATLAEFQQTNKELIALTESLAKLLGVVSRR